VCNRKKGQIEGKEKQERRRKKEKGQEERAIKPTEQS